MFHFILLVSGFEFSSREIVFFLNIFYTSIVLKYCIVLLAIFSLTEPFKAKINSTEGNREDRGVLDGMGFEKKCAFLRFQSFWLEIDIFLSTGHLRKQGIQDETFRRSI